LGNVNRLVRIVPRPVDQHGDAHNGGTLNPRALAHVLVISPKIDHDQYGPSHGDRTFVVGIVSAQIYHGSDIAHLIKVVNIIASPPNDNSAGRCIDDTKCPA